MPVLFERLLHSPVLPDLQPDIGRNSLTDPNMHERPFPQR
jgi:hypothetical protein